MDEAGRLQIGPQCHVASLRNRLELTARFSRSRCKIDRWRRHFCAFFHGGQLQHLRDQRLHPVVVLQGAIDPLPVFTSRSLPQQQQLEGGTHHRDGRFEFMSRVTEELLFLIEGSAQAGHGFGQHLAKRTKLADPLHRSRRVKLQRGHGQFAGLLRQVGQRAQRSPQQQQHHAGGERCGQRNNDQIQAGCLNHLMPDVAVRSGIDDGDWTAQADAAVFRAVDHSQSVALQHTKGVLAVAGVVETTISSRNKSFWSSVGVTEDLSALVVDGPNISTGQLQLSRVNSHAVLRVLGILNGSQQ